MTEPAVRRDGRCLHCGGKREVAKLKPLYRTAMLTDPFCSTECARAWHNTPLRPVGPGPAIGSRA